MEPRQRSPEDTFKRRLQRSKVKDIVKKPFDHISIHDKNGKCKFHYLKLALAFITIGTFATIIVSPKSQRNDHVSQAVSRLKWVWGASDPRYISNIDMNSDDIAMIMNAIPKQNSIKRIGLLNFDKKSEIDEWNDLIPNSEHVLLHLDYVPKNVTWDVLYPEWIDEEQENEVPTCPNLPKVEAPLENSFDLVVVKLPCRNEGNWSRDVARLHLQLAAAQIAVNSIGQGDKDIVRLIFVTKCFPLPNLFACKDLVSRHGNVWLYKPDLNVLRQKLQLPVGSCELALPFKRKGEAPPKHVHREAYATILHSAHVYVCGAIAAAQSIRMARSTRDLVILVDESIGDYHRNGLESAGWKIKTIQRIRNPKAEKDAYNEYNYSKFRLWQLTEYDKIIFIDADLLILRNIDFLFEMPEISATGNNGTLFNSGVMVLEPSNCTFRLLMDHINEIESYNGGDQGYLNEVFTWWHRIPKDMNFLKNFWVGDDEEVKRKKTRLFGADPPVLYVLHYLGLKPWLCFRDYDCNWNVDIMQEFASDVAHERWWRVHDAMPEKLQGFCMLRTKQKAQLEFDRREAKKANFSDGHWKIKIRDPRLKKCVDKLCSWKSMLSHWGENNWTDDQFSGLPPPAVAAVSLSGL